MSTEQNNQNKTKPNGNRKFNFYWIYAIIAVILISFQFFPFQGSPVVLKDISTFKDDMLLKGDVNRIVVVNKEYAEIFIKEDSLKKKIYTDDKVPEKGAQYKWIIGDTETFERQLTEWQEGKTSQPVTIMYETRHNILVSLLSWILPFVIILVIWILVMRRVTGGSGMGGGGQIFNIGKSKPQMYDKDTKVNVTFNDVAGLDEAKEEVMEVVDFLKNPKKYTSLGGKIPKGVLLVGPPGTGKTLLAKAMAGEAQVPFFSISGSDFVEMFVGVGASRVRDLFRQAREKAPCVIFIDEIDAIGRARGKNMIQSNDERENTLNQLLVEMDGFGTDKGVIILAATNRPDVLDPALLRPGRFDRQISIDKPDLAGREQIFNVHLKPIKVSPEVDAHKLAVQTPGFAGADIANVCNEAALIAARRGKKFVELQDFNDAIDRVIGGLEKKNKIISQEEKKIVAYHEAGHAICGWYLEYADPLVKVSIVPRGMAALGYAQYLPKEQYLYTKEQLTDMMCMTLGGRAAEDIIFGRISTGAQNDLERITKMSYAMVSIYGMNERIGNISFNDPNMDQRFSKPYSEQTAQAIDEEVKKMIDSAYQRTKKLLNEKRDQLEIIAKELLEKEIIFKADMERLIGHRPYDEKHPDLT
ncbi:MAG TPA: ATP-dependent zinc metalloprotease FtsH, partial [Chitinophagales bacterium]|nr:ATP-dependent zinc metalloprotease FtsH [Chitinophagales bacterium]HNJ90205.1 ATP-dependent zinc metalloprotease FtsH [Chitinophagales bacterium]HNM29305.1 ATP-dependent zinc metalloprotease FtsH [Chitinophagales bacterium]HNO29400.1 ATP-dependent zinc metalloprotease FtsH [Chitinophagales bacterium]